jgi:tripartite motif-containing protein 71
MMKSAINKRGGLHSKRDPESREFSHYFMSVFAGMTKKVSLKHSLVIFLFTLLLLPILSSSAYATLGDFLYQFGAPYLNAAQPTGVAVDSAGNVYVLDSHYSKLEVFSNSGVFLRRIGVNYQFNQPWGVAVDAGGNVYVADTGNNKVQVFKSDGTFVTQWGSYGSGNGQFNQPYGIAVDSSGNVFVADYLNNRVQVFKTDGTWLNTWGSLGNNPGQFHYPAGLAVDPSGNVFVADIFNSRVQVFTNNGAFLRTWSVGMYYGIAVNNGNVYVVDKSQKKVWVFDSMGHSEGSIGPGQLVFPTGIAVDSTGNVFVADYSVYNVQVYAGAPPAICQCQP